MTSNTNTNPSKGKQELKLKHNWEIYSYDERTEDGDVYFTVMCSIHGERKQVGTKVGREQTCVDKMNSNSFWNESDDDERLRIAKIKLEQMKKEVESLERRSSK